MRYIFLFFWILLLCSCSDHSSKSPATTRLSGHYVVLDVSVFNGRDSVLQHHQDVWVKEGIIERITDHMRFQLAEGVQAIEGSGKFLMPGLVDAHVHLSGNGAVPWAKTGTDEAGNLNAYLQAGITTVYDLGGLSSDLEKMKQKVAKGDWSGPQIFHTHIPITVPNSHPVPLTEQMMPWPLSGMVNAMAPTIESEEEAPKLMEKYLSNPVDYVKISCDQIPPGSPEMPYAWLKALIDEAHGSGKKVFVHIGSPQNALNAVKAGADILAHGVWRGRLSEAQADTIAAAGIPVIYTLAGFQNVAAIHQGHFHPSPYDTLWTPHEILDPVSGEAGKQVHDQEVFNAFFEDVYHQQAHWEHNFTLLRSKGVRILVGTDSALPGSYPGSTYYQEMEALQEMGMTPFEILSAATYGNAHLFLEDPDFGEIAPGKRADLLLLDNNPLEDLKAIVPGKVL